MPNSIKADPLSETREPSGNWFRELKIGEKPNLTLLRVLLSKLLFTKEPFTESDEIQAFTAYEWCVNKCADPGFARKYFFQLSLWKQIFVNFEAFVRNDNAKNEIREVLESFYSHGRKFLAASIFYGYRKLKQVKLVARRPSSPKPRNRIGVGYRDKGNARDPAWDGTPTWQEVALNVYRTQSVDNDVTAFERAQHIWTCLRCHCSAPWHNERIKRPKDSLLNHLRG